MKNHGAEANKPDRPTITPSANRWVYYVHASTSTNTYNEIRSSQLSPTMSHFVDLEKAFDTVPRKMAMATQRWMGAPESEEKMVEAMHENTKGRVVVGSGMSNEV